MSDDDNDNDNDDRVHAPSLEAALRALPDLHLRALLSEGGALRAAALDTVAEGLGLLCELAAEEVAQVVEAARQEIERRQP